MCCTFTFSPAHRQQYLLTIIRLLLALGKGDDSDSGRRVISVQDPGSMQAIERCPQRVLFDRSVGEEFDFVDESLGDFLLDPQSFWKVLL